MSEHCLDSNEWRVLICGGRDYGYDKHPVTKKLTPNFAQQKRAYDVIGDLVQAATAAGKTLIIIHGAARGADALADETSSFFGIKAIPFPADWVTYPKSAGPIRNRQMLKEGKPHLVVAFPGGKGTADMCDIAAKAGVPVRRIK
jgi:hypothetical protein